MAIELTPITTEREALFCPHCGKAILFASARECWPLGGEFLEDSDTIPMRSVLAPDQTQGIDFYCMLSVGRQSCCGKPYGLVAATIVLAEIDDAFRDTYFWHNDPNPPQETNFLARRGPMQWLVSAYPSPHGVVLDHWFPLRKVTGDAGGPNGVAACAGGPDWADAQTLLREMWGDLLEVQRTADFSSVE